MHNHPKLSDYPNPKSESVFALHPGLLRVEHLHSTDRNAVKLLCPAIPKDLLGGLLERSETRKLLAVVHMLLKVLKLTQWENPADRFVGKVYFGDHYDEKMRSPK